MKNRHAPVIFASLGCILGSSFAVPTLADPFSVTANGSTIYAESRNVPRFKMTYSRMHTASIERRQKAEMAALEMREKNTNVESDAEKNSLNKDRSSGSETTPR
ncbi:MAG: hypothetical protein ACU843_06125 [Gammaproteobacteria bacterium]